jgi:hypothetical protein
LARIGSKTDIDFTAEKRRESGLNKHGVFDLPEGHSFIAYMSDETTLSATRVFVKVRPSGKVHAYSLP